MVAQLASQSGHNGGLGHWGFAVVGALWIVIGSVQVARPDLSWKMRRFTALLMFGLTLRYIALEGSCSPMTIWVTVLLVAVALGLLA